MKGVLLLCLALTAACAHAQAEEASVAAERARLKQERERAEAEYQAQEKACYGKFAVNDCLATAKSRRREAVSDLRRQEVALNDAERKRKAAQRRLQIDGKGAQLLERDARHPAGAASRPGRGPGDGDGGGGGGGGGLRPALDGGAAKAAQREREVRERAAEQVEARRRRQAEAAEKAKAHERRLEEAKERAERVRKRLAERSKPPASSLKDP